MPDQPLLSDTPPFPTTCLYKYLSTTSGPPHWHDKFMQLVCGQAYFPSPRDFNDPFDCLPCIETPASIEDLETHRPGFIERIALSVTDSGVSLERARALLEATLPSVTPEALAWVVEQTTTRTSSEMGVFCLAECLDSVLMWSHYANNHRGIALRFDMRKQMRGGLSPLFKATYQNERPILDKFYEGLDPAEITASLCVKAKFWEYEQEWRAFKVGGARTFVEFSPLVVTGVVFGANCSAEDQQWVRSVIAGRPFTYERVVNAKRSFELQVVPA